MQPITTRTVALTDVARLKAALQNAGVRFAVQCDTDAAVLVFRADDARVAADTIAAELAR